MPKSAKFLPKVQAQTQTKSAESKLMQSLLESAVAYSKVKSENIGNITISNKFDGVISGGHTMRPGPTCEFLCIRTVSCITIFNVTSHSKMGWPQRKVPKT